MRSAESTNQTCYLCRGATTFDFLEMPPLPTQDGLMSNTRDEALQAIRGQIKLRYCKSCGYVGNEGHDPARITFDDYDFSNFHSPIFAQHTREISEYLIGRYHLRDKTIFDIGCGDGYFLQTICELGGNKGIGIDPGFNHTERDNKGLDLSFIRDYYNENYSHIKADLITCRHVISVINDPVSLLTTIRKNLESHPETIVYFDTPNMEYTFSDLVIWNVVYEHRSWFSQDSLKYLLEKCGFEVLHVGLCWNNEYINIEARPDPDFRISSLLTSAKLKEQQNTFHHFGSAYDEMLRSCRQKIESLRESDRKTIAWGAGARAVSFFNLFDLAEQVPYVIDINVKRQGKFIPGSGQEIMAPEYIKTYQPELVIITNPTYAAEIQQQVHELGVHPEFWVL